MMDDYPDGQGELWEELKIDGTFLQVFNGTIRRNLIAKVGTEAFCTYIVIKAYANFKTGIAFPSHETIAEHIGRDPSRIAGYLEKLYEAGLVRKKKVGRKNEYVIVESVPMLVGEEVVAYGERIYQPQHFQDFLNKLKEFGKHGDMPSDKHINITLNVQVINQGDNGTVNINNVSLTPEQLRAIQAIGNKTRKIG